MTDDHKHHSHDHDHSHDSHSHSHTHSGGFFSSHAHPVSNYGRAFAVGITLNLIFVVIEAGYGFFSNSLALLSDAGHNLSDVLGLFLAWFATWLTRRRPTAQFTYGFRSSSILAAVINAVVLLVAVVGIIWEAVVRFSHPAAVDSRIVMSVAAIGILVNGVTAYLFSAGRKSDLNIRGAFTHMVADTLVSLGVVVAGFLILQTGYAWIDPVVSIAIGVVIVGSTIGLLKDSVSMALAGVPRGIDTGDVADFLIGHDEVSRVHDLHIWPLSTSQTALTAHLVRANTELPDRFLFELGRELHHKFNIGHVTIQVERGDDPKFACPLDSAGCT